MRFYYYRLVCKDLSITDAYIGCTRNLTQRKYMHKFNCNNPNSKMYNYKVYDFIRKNGNMDNWDIILINFHDFDSNIEAHKQERIYMEEYKPTLNIQIPSRNIQEYRNTYHDKLNERLKIKYSCDCGGCYTYRNKQTHYKSKIHLNYLKYNINI